MCRNVFMHIYYIHMVHFKRNATNVPQRHLKTWRHVCHFLPPKTPHFLGRAAVHRLVKHHNSRIVHGAFCRENVAHLAKITAIHVPALLAHIQRQSIKVNCNFLSKSGTQIFTNCCILFTCTVCTNVTVNTHESSFF